jgi:4-amino-4-deoxy-L-arabinose transferase-like glycosyltransferase
MVEKKSVTSTSPYRRIADCIHIEKCADARIALLLFIGSLAYLWLFRSYTVMDPDEGILLQGGQRILNGELLYRDFFSFYTPGSYYLLALVFKLFGSSFLEARTVLVFFGAIYSAFTYVIARRVCGRGSSVFAAAVVLATALPYRFLVLHNWDSTLWACFALYCALPSIEKQSWGWSFATGSFAALTFLFEQSKGAGLILGLGAGVLALRLLSPKTNFNLAAGLMGMVWPIALTFAYFGVHHSLREMIADWAWPLAHYSAANKVPYGYQGWSDATRHALFGSGAWLARVFYLLTFSASLWIPVLPLLALVFLVYWIVRSRREGVSSKSAYYIFVCATLCGLLLSVVVVRADIIHFIYLQPLFILVLAWMVDGGDIPGKYFANMRPGLVAFVAISLTMFASPLLMRAASARFQIATRRGVVKSSGSDSVIGYVQARVPPGEIMFVYPYLPLYNYLPATRNPTRYEYFQPGMNTPEQAQEILSDLHSMQVAYVLFESSFSEKIPRSWPNTPMSAVAHDPIADFILQQYQTCQVLHSPQNWQFLFMARKGKACP